jgi:TatD DNase family protein
MVRFFDTHAHYDDKRFARDRDSVLNGLPEKGIELVMNPGSDMRASRASVELAEKYPFIYAAVGVHPHDADTFTESNASELKKLAARPKVLAIGEIGLDYYRDLSPRDKQAECFERQLALAEELQMPVIVHDRDAHEDTLAILRNFKLKNVVYHCYSGSREYAKILLNLGWHISFTGAITFKNARHSHETIQYMPLDRLMLETDAPYLAPHPYRGERNDSAFMPLIAESAAHTRGIPVEELAEAAFVNGARFFGIDI